MSSWEVLVVGEAPGPLGPSEYGPLACARYLDRMPGLMELNRINLLQSYPGAGRRGSGFPHERAVRAADQLWRDTPIKVSMVYASVRVANAFGIGRHKTKPDYPYCEWFTFAGRRVAVAPHPSGVNRWWNVPHNADKAREFFRSIQVERAALRDPVVVTAVARPETGGTIGEGGSAS